MSHILRIVLLNGESKPWFESIAAVPGSEREVYEGTEETRKSYRPQFKAAIPVSRSRLSLIPRCCDGSKMTCVLKDARIEARTRGSDIQTERHRNSHGGCASCQSQTQAVSVVRSSTRTSRRHSPATYFPFPSANNKCGFRSATSKIVCANTEFAQANQLRV